MKYNIYFLAIFFTIILNACSTVKVDVSEKTFFYPPKNYYRLTPSIKIKVCLYKNPDTIYVKVKNKKYKLLSSSIPERFTLYIPSDSNGLTWINGFLYRGKVFAYRKDKDIYIVNEISLEDYLKGVVPREVPFSWNLEVLKAQAVASRTYAYYMYLKNKNSICAIGDGISHQVYGGYLAERESTNKAIKETTGEILLYNGKPIISYFHSVCGDFLLEPSKIWKGAKSLPYYKTQKCRYRDNTPYSEWEYKIKKKTFCKYFLKTNYCSIRLKKDKYGYVKNIILFSRKKKKILYPNDVRKYLGYSSLKSSFFVVKPYKDVFVFIGKGWGHSVGMCQWCAKNMADIGYSYKEILAFFYPNTYIGTINEKGKRESTIARRF